MLDELWVFEKLFNQKMDVEFKEPLAKQNGDNRQTVSFDKPGGKYKRGFFHPLSEMNHGITYKKKINQRPGGIVADCFQKMAARQRKETARESAARALDVPKIFEETKRNRSYLGWCDPPARG